MQIGLRKENTIKVGINRRAVVKYIWITYGHSCFYQCAGTSEASFRMFLLQEFVFHDVMKSLYDSRPD